MVSDQQRCPMQWASLLCRGFEFRPLIPKTGQNSSRAPASPLSTFRMNTCESVSKQRALSPFRMNTYAKTGGGHTLDIVAVQSSGPLNALSPLSPITSLQPLQFHAI